MIKKKLHNITVILRSCLTGKVVWIYQGPSKDAARKAYKRACDRELERVRNWGQTAAARKGAILSLLARLTEPLSVTGPMTPEQQAAARRIASIAEKGMPCHTEFYDHIVESRRRRTDAHRNRSYDK